MEKEKNGTVNRSQFGESCVFVHSKSEIREFLIVNSRSGGTVFARGETGNGRKGKGKRKSLKQVDYLADLVPEQL